jgi:hypothetical protein
MSFHYYLLLYQKLLDYLNLKKVKLIKIKGYFVVELNSQMFRFFLI